MITPRTLKGFRDFLPDSMIHKKELISNIENTFNNYGFAPIDTPALEYTEILLGKGGGETDKQIYRFEDHGKRDIALRFDLTVPLARFVSQHFDKITFPFKCFHIAPVWRGENTQKGRFREFYQCDFDILGTTSKESDLEILLVIKSGLLKIIESDFRINVNNRKILNGILKKMDLVDKSTDILRTIDKIYKIGLENVKKELVDIYKINAQKIASLLELLNLNNSTGVILGELTGENIFNLLEKIKSYLDNEDNIHAADLESIFKTLDDLKILKHFSYNPVITRGLDYYTGIVFETFILDQLDFGSICSGGGYDNLAGLYSKNLIPGVGASFGLDRLLSLLESKDNFEKKISNTDILIFNIENKYFSKYHEISEKLRDNNINTEVFFENKKIQQQFKYAEKKSINFVLFAGENEIKNERYNVKNIKTGVERKSISVDEVISLIKDE